MFYILLFVTFYHSFFVPACGMAQIWKSALLIKAVVTSFAIIPLEVIILLVQKCFKLSADNHTCSGKVMLKIVFF